MENMKYKYLITILICLVLCLAGCREETPKRGIAITNASIIDVINGHVSNNMTIIVNDSIISRIAKSDEIKTSEYMRIIDASGKYVIPGLWDMHIHTSSEFNTREIIYPTFIAYGVTGVRVMSADCFEPCWELQLNIKQSRKIQADVKAGNLIGPRSVLASTYISGAPLGKPSTVKAPGTKEHGKELVHLLIDRGVDFIKIYDELPREAYFGIAEEAVKQGIPFVGHVPVTIKASGASKAGQKSIEHCCEGSLFEECSELEDVLREEIQSRILSRNPINMNELVLKLVKSYDEVKCQDVLNEFLKNGTWFVPTLIAAETDQPIRLDWRNNEELKYVPRTELEWWYGDEKRTIELYGDSYPEIRNMRFKMVRDMNRSGVNLLAGSDPGIYGIFYGSGLHDELILLVEAGLSELEALQTATLNVAKYLERSNSLGNVKEGMLADMLILDANPLENISNTKKINAVLSNGIYFGRNRLTAILDKVAVEAQK